MVHGLGLAWLLLQAPQTISIPDHVECSSCRIILSKVASIGSLDSPHAPTNLADVVQNSRGEFIVGPIVTPGAIAVFDSTGRYIRTFGRSGSGPGEQGNAFNIFIGAGDSVYVADLINQRINVFDGNYRFVRQVTAVRPREIVALPKGRILVNAAGSSEQSAGFVLHVLNANGVTEVSFSETNTRLDRARLTRRAISAGSEGIWSGHPNRYVIDHFDRNGRTLATIRRGPDWFQEWSSPDPGQPYATRPPPTVWSVREDHRGYLWVIVGVPDANWHPTTRPRTAADLTMAQSHGWTDAVVEILDPRSAKVLIRQRFDEPLLTLRHDLVATRRDGPAGEIILEIFRLVVSGPF